jgi:hypothetical protein
VTTYSAQSVVFIDSRVPDLQDLLDGLQPGEQAFVIDPSSDGIQQIADILAANNLTGLSSISIVSHGESGALELGSSFITDANLSDHSNALAEIGASLAPGGAIQLYGCDVALGTGGQQFINDFSTLAGGAAVEGATHIVGSAALGGSWTLDASSITGANGGANTPFTPTALANFQGDLAASPVTEVWIAATGGSNDSAIVHDDDTGNGTGTNSVTLFHESLAGNPSTNYPASLSNLTDIALDPTDNLYFLAEQDEGNGTNTPGNNPNVIWVGTLAPELTNPTGTPTLTSIYSQGGNVSATGVITGLAIDPSTKEVFFTEHKSLLEVAYTGGTVLTLATGAGNVFADGLALDKPHNQAFFFSNSTSGVFTTNGVVNEVTSDAIYVDSNLTVQNSTPTQIKFSPADTTIGAGNFPVSLGLISGIAVDTTSEKLYFTTQPIHDPVSHTTGTGGIYEYDLSQGTSGTYNVIWLESSSNSLFLSYIDIDHATNKYYVTADQSGDAHPSIYDGALSGGTAAQSPTLFADLTMTSITQNAEGLAIDNAPSLTISATNPTFTESSLNPASLNNTPVGLITGATASDSDNTSLRVATVSIGSFFAGDVLTFSNNNNITGSYNSTTGVLTFSGIDSFAHYQTALDSVDFTSTSDNPTDYGSDNSRTLSWVVNDGLITSAPQTEIVSVVGVNDPPTLSNVAASAHYTEEGAGGILSSALSVIDVDDLNLSSATVKITGGSFAGDTDVLAATTIGTSIAASYNSSTQTLTLTGTDTLAHYQQVLDSVNFTSGENPTNYGSNQTRVITWQVMDPSGTANGGVSISSVSTTTLTITNVNDAPTLSNVANSVSFTEGQAVTLSSAVMVSDPDNLGLQGATVKIAGGTFAGDADVLTTSTTGTHVTASYNSTTETLTLTGSDTLANYQAVLDKITFGSGSNPDDYGSQHTRTITWVLNDGSGSFNLSTAQTETVSITAINDPPVLSSVATSAAWTEEQAGATTLSSALSVSDPDNLNLANATVSIVSGKFAGDQDVLSASTSGTSVTVSYNSTSETLTLSGADTLAHYQQVLDSVTFSAVENPTNYGSNATRTVTWLLNDGSGSNNLSSVATTTVSITNVNDAPTLSNVATSAHFTEEGAAVTLSNAVSVTDPDNLDLASATVSISGGTFANDQDVLAATGNGTITASYDSTNERLILSGSDTLANYQSVLDTVIFSAGENPTNFGSNATRTVTWVLNDGSGSFNLSTARTTTVSITNVNDPPTLANVATTAFWTEEVPPTTLSNHVTVTDPDDLDLVSATVQVTGGTFTNDNDVLSATPTGNITVSYNSSTETLTLTGSDTLADYQTALDTVAFHAGENPTNFGSDPTRTITWVLNDGGASFALSTAQTTTVTVVNVNDAPTLNNVATSAHFTEEGAAVTLSNAVSVIDPDNLALAGATVSIATGTFANDGDVLAANTTGTSITASYNSTNELLVLSGSDTLAHYQQVLDSVTFNAGENPTDFGSNLTRQVTWVLNDGVSSNNLSAVATTTVSITNVNDAPTLSGVASSLTVAPSAVTTISPALSVSDPDNLTLVNATVSITGGTFASDGDVLAATTTSTNIAASYDSTTERLTLTGSDTLAHYQQVLESVTFDANAADPTNGGANPTRTLTWVANDGSGSFNTSAPQTTTITIQNGPAVNPPATANYTEEGGSITLAPSLGVTDSNGSTTLVGATVAITSGTFGGDQDVLGFDTTGTSITAAYNTSTETLTLSGSDTLANYQHVLDSVTFVAAENPTNFGSDPTRTVVWTVNDGGASNNTGTATTTINITNINDAPTLAIGTTVAAWTEEQAQPTSLAPAAAVSDADNLKLASATVQITGGTFAGDADVLAATPTGNITVSYNSSTETLLLTGSDTLADYQTVLNGITFNAGENPTDFGSDATRTITWVLNDGSGSFATSPAQTTTVSITNVNDPPTLTSVASSVGYTLSQTVTLSPATSVADPDNLSLVDATVAITGGTFAGDGDVLAAATAGTNIAASYDTTSETLTLTGSDTLAHYQSVLDSITFASGADPSNGGVNPTRTLSWVVNDGSSSFNLSAAQTTTISVHAGPAIFVPASAAYTEEQGTTTTLAPNVTLNDTNNTTTLTSATVALTGGTFANDHDVLSATATGNITVNYDSTNERLVLSGSDTLTNYQTVLDSVTFTAGENPTNFGSDPTRTVTWTVDDSGTTNNTGTATSTIAVTAINDAPTLSNVNTGFGGNDNYTENGAALTVSGALSVTDPDNLTLAGATVSITTGTFAGDGDVLAVNTAGTSITASYNSSTETLTLTGVETTAHYQQVLDSLTFSSTSHNPTDFGSDQTRQVTWVVNDGGTSFNLSNVATTTVTVVAVDDAPTLSNVTTADAFTAGTTVTLSPSVTVSDVDNLKLASATVSFTGGSFAGDGDVLGFSTAGTSITASYNSTSETLTLTGSDTLADYQAVLDSVTFASGPNPNNNGANPTRTVTWVVNDGTLSSTAATTTVNIAHVPPTLTSVASSLAFTQGQTLVISPSITVSDPDSSTLTGATVSITGGTFAGDGDALSATGTASISVSYNSTTETLTLTGTDTLAHYQSVLDSVKFSSGANPTNSGVDNTRTVTWVVNDGNASNGLSAPQTTTIDLVPQPTLSHVAASVGFVENASPVTLSPTLSVSDTASTTLSGATVAIAAGAFANDGDVLTATPAGNIVVSYDSTSEALTLTGSDTLAHYQTVLDSVTFVTPSDNPTDYGSDPTRTVTWQVNDFGVASAITTTTVSITAVNDAPTLTSVAASVSFTEGNTLQLSPTAAVSDPDNLNLANATVKITGGTFANDGDQLAANVAGTHITASYNAATETLALTGSDPLATYQAVLDSITFASGDNPTNYGSNLTRTVTWVLNDGSGSNNLSSTVTETVSITAINDPPALSGLADASYSEEGAPVTLSGSASVSDPDNLTLANATVAIVGGTFAGDGDVLTFNTTGTTIAASYNSASETLTLSGSDSLAHYQQVLDSIIFSSRPENPNNYGSNPTRTVTWLLNDGSASNNLSTVQTTTVTVTNVNDAPTLTNVPSTLAWTEESSTSLTLSSTVSVTDPDNLTFPNATVAITGGTFAGDGDVLTADTTGTSITASYDSTTETLTLTGDDTPANYTQVLESITFTTRPENPNNYGSDPTRTIVWTVNDGGASNNLAAATTTVSITNINDAPTLANVATTAFFTEHGGAAILSSAVSVSDPDDLDLVSATVAITGGTFAGDGDVLAATAVGSVTVSYSSSTETLTLTGTDTLAHYQTVLDSVTFTAGPENPNNFGSDPTRTVVWTLNDGGGTANGGAQVSTPVTSTISVTNINDPPTLANVATSQNYTEGGPTPILSTNVSVSDPDDLDLSSATVAITGGTFAGDGDTLGISGATSGTVSAISFSYNSSTETLTLSGADALPAYRALLDEVTFGSSSLNPTDYGSDPTRAVTWTLMDPSGTANGGVNTSTPVTSTVSITAVNNPPTLSNVATVVSVRAAQPTVTVSPNASVSDPDNLTLAGATVSITGGTFAGDGDVLAANVAGTSITASYNAATETLTLSGSDTLAHYQQVLDSVTFDSTSANPTNSGVDKTRTVSWVLNDGSGSNNLSAPATTTITFGGAVAYDFNGDGKSDLLFQNTNATPQIWLMNGTSVISQTSLAQPPVQWRIVGSGDFNADGDADILWINTISNQPAIWEMNGTSVISAVGLVAPPSSWRIAGIGDFDGNGTADILWQNSNGQPSIWEMNGTSIVSMTGLATPPPQWRIVATGDFNGDGKSDILWYNTISGQPSIWEMNGTSVISAVGLTPQPANMEIIGTGDFAGNGDADILWLNTSNNTPTIWMMNGTSVVSTTTLPAPPSAWRLVGTSDVNGDGKADLLWQNTNDGTVTVWEMNGTSIAVNTPVGTPGLSWILNNNDPPLPATTPSGTNGTASGDGGTMHLSMPDAANGTMHQSMPDGTNGNAGSSGQPTFGLPPNLAVPFGGGAAELALTTGGTTVANSLHIGGG